MQAPTGDMSLSVPEPPQVFVGGDPAGGGTDLDGEATYTLDFAGAPDPQQGYHVKVTVHTQAAADGAVKLTLPGGWHADPGEARFHRTTAGDTEPIVFSISVRASAAHSGVSGAPR